MTQQLHPHPTPRRARKRPQPSLKSPICPTRPWWRSRYFLTAGWALALLSLLFDASSHLQATAADDQNACDLIVQSATVLSRAQLAKILTVPERSSQQSIRDIVAEPYCQLPPIELRDSITAEREAYPLAFAPSTWLVMLYEGDEYAGFSFRFQ